MLSNLKSALKNSFVYSLGNLSVKLIGLILLPIYLKALSVSDYGVLAMLEVTSQLLIDLFSFNLSLAMLRWAAGETDEIKKKKIISTAYLATAVISLLLCAFLIPFSKQFSFILFESTDYKNYLSLLFISSAIMILNNVPLNILRLQQKSVFYAVLTTLQFVVILILNIYFVVYCNYGVLGIVISQLIGNVFVTLLLAPLVFKNVTLMFDNKLLKSLVFYGIPLAFSTISTNILTFGDRYILNYFMPLSSVGVYSLGVKIAGLLKVLLLQSFQLGFIPIAFKMFDEPNSKRFFTKVMTYFVFILVITSLILSVFGAEGISLFTSNKEYFSAATVIPLLSLTFVITGIRYMVTLGFHYSRKTKYEAAIVIFGSVLNIILNILLIPIFSFVGSALAMLLSIIAITGISYYYSAKYYPVPYEIKRLAQIIGLAIILYLISIFLPLSGHLLISAKIFLIITFPIILKVFKFYEPVELETISRFWSEWRNPLKWKNNFKKLLGKQN